MMQSRWMVFVDGENLTIRAQDIAGETRDLSKEDENHNKFSLFYRKDICYWPYQAGICNVGSGSWLAHDIMEGLAGDAIRCHYYTSATGDDVTLDEIRDQLREHGFMPHVFKKKAQSKKSKGVDISLTKDMLVHAFFNNYDLAVLIAGDADYVPLIEEVMRLGKRVVIAFFSDHEKCGLALELKRKADNFLSLNKYTGFIHE